MSKVTLKLFGKFELTDSTGIDRTPLGSKSRGLIALLALSPDFTRSKKWLQDRLWSDRFSEQSNDSLRQALSDIRKGLGSKKDLLTSKGGSVFLSPDKFGLDSALPQTNGIPVKTELFPNLIVKDVKFSRWLEKQRQFYSTQLHDELYRPAILPHKKNTVLFFKFERNDDRQSRQVATKIFKYVSKSLLEYSEFIILSDFIPTPQQESFESGNGVMILISIDCCGPVSNTSATIANPISGEIHWMDGVDINSESNSDQESEEILSFCASLFENILSSLSDLNRLTKTQYSGLLNYESQSLIFHLDKESLACADKNLSTAYELEPEGHCLALRSFLRNLCWFEHKSTDFLSEQYDMEVLSAEAMAENPRNSTVLAVASQIEYLTGDSLDRGLYLAQQSVEQNPINPFGLAMLANAYIVTGDFRSGSQAADRALKYVGCNKTKFFLEFFCCMAAAGNKDYFKAIKHGEAAYYLKPTFKAPLRYLLVLYLQTRQKKKFEKAYWEMKQFEPEFNIQHLLENFYPSHTLRRLPLIGSIEKNADFYSNN